MPSMAFARGKQARLPLAPPTGRAFLTTLQTSLHAADRSVAHPLTEALLLRFDHRALTRGREPRYRGPWRLLGPDSHRLAAVSLSPGYVMTQSFLSWRPNCWTHFPRERRKEWVRRPRCCDVVIRGVNTFRITDSKIVERWGRLDDPGLLQRLGAFPPTGYRSPCPLNRAGPHVDRDRASMRSLAPRLGISTKVCPGAILSGLPSLRVNLNGSGTFPLRQVPVT